jgi:hypothetical protein
MAELESSKDCHVDCQAWPCTVVVPALLLFLIVPVMKTASRRSVKGALGGRKHIVITYLSTNRGFLVSSLIRRGPLRSPNLAHLGSGIVHHCSGFGFMGFERYLYRCRGRV